MVFQYLVLASVPRAILTTLFAFDHGREMVWFHIDIGRERNAAPRWLLPLLCRAGNVTKAEIGSIKIFARDKRFQIAAEVADKYADAARSMKPNEGRISRIGASMDGDAGMRGNSPFAARQHKTEVVVSSDPETLLRAKTQWRDRNKEKGSAHPYPKGGAPKGHSKGPGMHSRFFKIKRRK